MYALAHAGEVPSIPCNQLHD